MPLGGFFIPAAHQLVLGAEPVARNSAWHACRPSAVLRPFQDIRANTAPLAHSVMPPNTQSSTIRDMARSSRSSNTTVHVVRRRCCSRRRARPASSICPRQRTLSLAASADVEEGLRDEYMQRQRCAFFAESEDRLRVLRPTASTPTGDTTSTPASCV